MKSLCKVCARARGWSHRVPRPRRVILVQAMVLVVVAQAPKARPQGLTTPAAAAPSSATGELAFQFRADFFGDILPALTFSRVFVIGRCAG